MIGILLLVIACCLLFGKEKTKGGLKGIGNVIWILLIILSVIEIFMKIW